MAKSGIMDVGELQHRPLYVALSAGASAAVTFWTADEIVPAVLELLHLSIRRLKNYVFSFQF
jgi:hypothetical protein